MSDSVRDVAGEWLAEIWSDLLNGGGYFTDYIGGWNVAANAGVMLHCSQECPTDWTCFPETCLQHQPYIQIRVERSDYARFVYVQNDVDEAIQVALRYYDPLLDEWTSGCWWTFQPGEAAYLAMEGGRVTTTTDTLGMYAETLDGSMVWNGDGSYVRSCGSNSLDLFEWTNVDGDGDFSIRFVSSENRRLDGENGAYASGEAITDSLTEAQFQYKHEIGNFFGSGNNFPDCEKDEQEEAGVNACSGQVGRLTDARIAEIIQQTRAFETFEVNATTENNTTEYFPVVVTGAEMSDDGSSKSAAPSCVQYSITAVIAWGICIFAM